MIDAVKIKRSTVTINTYEKVINMKLNIRVAVISAKNRKRQRRKRQSVTAKREKSQTPKVLTA